MSHIELPIPHFRTEDCLYSHLLQHQKEQWVAVATEDPKQKQYQKNLPPKHNIKINLLNHAYNFRLLGILRATLNFCLSIIQVHVHENSEGLTDKYKGARGYLPVTKWLNILAQKPNDSL